MDDEVKALPDLIARSERTMTLNPVVGVLVHNAGSVLVIAKFCDFARILA